MWKLLAPIDAVRHIKQSGLVGAAKMVGLTPDQLTLFLETYKTREAPKDTDKGEVREIKEFKASGLGQLNLWEYFPDSVPSSGRPRKHDPIKVQMLLDEHPRQEVANIMGISVGALNNYISTNRLFAPRTKVSRPDGTDLREALETGTAAEAARMYGVSVTTVYRWASEEGVETSAKSTVPPKEELEPLLAQYTQAEVADVYGVQTMTVSRWARSYGIKSKRTRQLEQRKQIAKMQETMSLREISETLGIPLDKLK